MRVRLAFLALPFLITTALSLWFAWPTPWVIGLVVLTGMLPLAGLLHREHRGRLSDGLLARMRQQESWHFLERVLDLIPYPVYIKDAQSRYLLVNQAQVDDKHIARDDLLGHLGLSPTATPEVIHRHFEEDGRVLAGERIFKEEHKTHYNTGQEVFRIIAKEGSRDAQGRPVIVGIHFNITELRQAQRAVQQALERETALRKQMQDFVQRLIDVIPDPFYIKNATGRYVMVNDAYAIYQQLPKEIILSETFPPPPTPSNIDSRRLSLEEDRRVLAGEELQKEEHRIRTDTGEEIFRIVLKRRSVFFDGSPVVIGIDHNITRWKVAERDLLRQAQEDSLTGIANRRHFSSQAENTIRRAERYREPLALIMLDLDHFKQVNDKHGHRAGDQVLQQAVRRIVGSLRSSDMISRWGGEEFVILLPSTDTAEALLAAERLRRAIVTPPMIIEGTPMTITFSAGLARRLPGESLDAIIVRADVALYQAKNNGRDQVVVAEGEPDHAA